jgi:hypothetical protein
MLPRLELFRPRQGNDRNSRQSFYSPAPHGQREKGGQGGRAIVLEFTGSQNIMVDILELCLP